MKVYIAAPYVRRHEAQNLSRALQAHDIDVTSRWLVVGDALDDAGARKDLEDIDDADALIAFNMPEWRREGGGRHAEFGYAIAQGKRLIVYGERSIIFHYLNGVEIVCHIEDLITRLAPVAAETPSV